MDTVPRIEGPRLPPGRPRLPRRALEAAALVLAVLVLASGSYFVVEPTEMAGVRRFGTVVSAAPLGPGLHWKLPLIDSVDTLQISLTQFTVDDLTVHSVDNQSVTVGIGLTYRVPPDAVFKLLYGVGRSGNADIELTLRPMVADRALRVFARHNTVDISAQREQIAGDIRKLVSEAVRNTFGIEVVDLQLSRIQYSETFVQSVEAAVRAKNDAIQAENTVARVRYEGEQAKVQAEAQATAAISRAHGEAQSAIEQARGEKESSVLRAEGQAQATELTGAANARATQLLGVAVTANPRVVEFEAARRWNGQLPSTMVPGGGVPMIGLPGQPGK